MKRRAFIAMIGTTAALQVCSAGAFDNEAMEKNGLKAGFGFELQADDDHIVAEYNLEIAADQTKKMSFNAVGNIDDEEYDLKLDDALIIDSENFYINVKEAMDTISQVDKEQKSEEILGPIGEADGWIALPITDFDKLGIKFDQEAVAPKGELDPALQEDLKNITSVFGPKVENGVTSYCIDNNTILEAAEKADEFLAEHQEEVFGVPSENTFSLKDMDLNGAFEKYINAVGAGMAEATGVPEEQAIETLNQLISTFTQFALSSYNADAVFNNQAAATEALSEMQIYELAQEALAGSDIRASYTYDDNSAEVVVGVDGNMFVAHAAIQEDDTVSIEIGDGEEVFVNGVAEKKGDVLVGELKNLDDKVIGDIELGLSERSAKVTALDAEGKELSIAVEIPENGLSFEIGNEEDFIALSMEGFSDETKGNGSFELKASSAGSEVKAVGYTNYEIPSEPLTIEIPEAADGLEMIKKISAKAFKASLQEAEGDTLDEAQDDTKNETI